MDTNGLWRLMCCRRHEQCSDGVEEPAESALHDGAVLRAGYVGDRLDQLDTECAVRVRVRRLHSVESGVDVLGAGEQRLVRVQQLLPSAEPERGCVLLPRLRQDLHHQSLPGPVPIRTFLGPDLHIRRRCHFALLVRIAGSHAARILPAHDLTATSARGSRFRRMVPSKRRQK